MQVTIKAKYVRILPRKMRLAANIVRGLDASAGLEKLSLIKNRARLPLQKALLSALANARHNYELEDSNLYIKEIRVDEGPVYARWMPRAHGRASAIRKQTSHIIIVLAEKIPGKKKIKAKKPSKIETVRVDEKMSRPEAEKVEVDKKDEEAKDARESHKAEIFDVRRKGGYRDMQQQEKTKQKEKGFFRKMFRRKAGE